GSRIRVFLPRRFRGCPSWPRRPLLGREPAPVPSSPIPSPADPAGGRLRRFREEGEGSAETSPRGLGRDQPSGPLVSLRRAGRRDRTAFEGILAALGKEWVDLDALASGGRPLDSEGRSKIAQVASAPDPSSCIAGTLALLREGYAAVSVAEGLAAQAASKVVAAKGYDLETARGVMFAHAARFVLTFSRTGERLYALFQAALRVRSPPAAAIESSVAEAAGEGEELCHLAGAFDARRPEEAVARVRSYLHRGYSRARLLHV